MGAIAARGANNLSLDPLFRKKAGFPGDERNRMGHRSRRVANSNPIRLALSTGLGGRKQQQNRCPNNSTKTQLHSETSVLNQQADLW
jgi:hypothetical protein